MPAEPIPTFAVGEDRVRHRGGTAPIEASTLVCSCAGRTCTHVAAVLVVLTFADPTRRTTFEAPAWEIALSVLGAPTSPRTHERGRLSYDIRRPAPGQPGLVVEPRVHRPGRNPAPWPRRLEELETMVDPLTPDERELHGTWTALEQARRLERTRTPVVCRLLSRLMLGPLSEAADVRLDGVPVKVSTVPVVPRIVGTPRTDGGLDLHWEPRVRLHWSDAGIVLCDDGEIRPLADGVPPEAAARLLDPLPPVPGADVNRFVEQMVVDRRLRIDLPDGIDPVAPPDARVARLVLAEVEGDLQASLQLVYQREGVDVVVGAPFPTARVRGVGRVRRDLDWERYETERFRNDVGGDPLVLGPMAALDWLRDTLPGLARRWEVHGDDRLVRFTVRGAVTPTIRFSEGEDWFDLDVTYTLGGRPIPAAEVLEGWLRGERLLRLDDGSLAELPSRWLDRHYPTIDTLAEVRRAQRKLGSWNAWMASDLLEEVGAAADRWLGWVHRLAARDGVARNPPPPGLRTTLRPYQQHGFDWLCFLRDHGLHGLLADEMGLGKTVQALAVILDDPRDRPSLVVAPTSVLHGWVDEAARFAPELRVVAWHGPDRRPETLDQADLVVTTYALLRRDADRLAAREWSWVILDEGQNIKNPVSQTARAARRLQARHRLVLTGTPLENDLLELWSLFQFLMPGYLGRRSAFHARYAVSGRAGGIALDDLANRIRPFLLRRRKAEVATELPPRTEVTVRVPLSDRERRLYEVVKNTVRASLEPTGDEPFERRVPLLLEGLTRLRQACCHPALLPFPEARHVGRSAKLEALLEKLDEALPSGSRALVFSQWVRLLDEVAAVLADRGIPFLRLDGGTRDRGEVVRTFQAEGGPPVLLISIKAGGTGLNLTAADLVFHLDPWWNPAVEDQATDRAHRIGQKRPVTVYRLVAADTVEDRVLALQAHKRRLFEQTVDLQTLDVSALTTDDFVALLSDAALMPVRDARS